MTCHVQFWQTCLLGDLVCIQVLSTVNSAALGDFVAFIYLWAAPRIPWSVSNSKRAISDDRNQAASSMALMEPPDRSGLKHTLLSGKHSPALKLLVRNAELRF